MYTTDMKVEIFKARDPEYMKERINEFLAEQFATEIVNILQSSSDNGYIVISIWYKK